MEIARLELGGGVLAICPMPGRGGDYAADLAAIRALDPALVVSLAGGQERAAAGAGGLPGDLAGAGIAWAEWPVADFGVPDAAGAADWPALAGRMRGVLAGGGRVLVHCMGGCGRSGMAALRLMVEAGEPPGAALARLRAVRPCAVETGAQQDWAAGGTGAAHRA